MVETLGYAQSVLHRRLHIMQTQNLINQTAEQAEQYFVLPEQNLGWKHSLGPAEFVNIRLLAALAGGTYDLMWEPYVFMWSIWI